MFVHSHPYMLLLPFHERKSNFSKVHKLRKSNPPVVVMYNRGCSPHLLTTHCRMSLRRSLHSNCHCSFFQLSPFRTRSQRRSVVLRVHSCHLFLSWLVRLSGCTRRLLNYQVVVGMDLDHAETCMLKVRTENKT